MYWTGLWTFIAIASPIDLFQKSGAQYGSLVVQATCRWLCETVWVRNGLGPAAQKYSSKLWNKVCACCTAPDCIVLYCTVLYCK